MEEEADIDAESRSGWVTPISMQVGDEELRRPPSGRYTSAGRARECLIRSGSSVVGARCADLHSEASASRRELCRIVRKLPDLHVRA